MPDNRARLYDRLVRLQLLQWDKVRFDKDNLSVPLHGLWVEADCREDEFVDGLAALAWAVHNPGREMKTGQPADISEMELRTALERLHPSQDTTPGGQSRKADWALRVVTGFKQRGGLLREEGRGVFKFPHRSYQEGLAWKRRDNVMGPEDYDPVFQTRNHPRVGVNWYEAAAYCRWLTEVLQARGEMAANERITLPAETQWERAARQTDGRLYPWGNDEGHLAERCNMGATGIGSTSAVGLFPQGQEEGSAADTAGNVREWCSEWSGHMGRWRVLRGGSRFLVIPGLLRCSFRYRVAPITRSQYCGFRCVWVLG